MADSKPLPPLPLTLEGSSLLHQMFRLKLPLWRALDCATRRSIAEEAGALLASTPDSAAYSLLGHKGDLLLIHFRAGFTALREAESAVRKLRLSDYIEPSSSYLSVVELGLYESTAKTYRELIDRGVTPHSEEWTAALEDVLSRQREAMRSRLFPAIPEARFVCFYPMDRLRGETSNWYMLPLEERQRQMHEHGLVGRRYAGRVKQIISGSIGFDDWEWGVDLFADDPLVFKHLIYEMRFDEVSAVYAKFGAFYVGERVAPADFPARLGL